MSKGGLNGLKVGENNNILGQLISSQAYLCMMKKLVLIVIFNIQFTIFNTQYSVAQCSVCTKTAQQMGEKPARGLNYAILYLAAIPFAVAGTIGYRWWKGNSHKG